MKSCFIFVYAYLERHLFTNFKIIIIMKALHTSILDTLANYLEFNTAVEIAFEIIDAACDALYTTDHMLGDLVDYISDHYDIADAEDIAKEVIINL